ncbi:MAG: hypothetical protein IJV30_06965 [Oscillospiraceae bacterium]|nr:hypothetical protein [Oscillospiraceae bacterium]
MRRVLLHLTIYICGLISVCAGIVLCKKCAMGMSPVSSIPYVLSLALPLTFGQLTMCFHFVNIAGQMILQKKILIKTSLQIVLALAFSTIIDWFDTVIRVNSDILIFAILSLIFSIIFTALGMVLMVWADLVQNPVDGFVKQVSDMTALPLGRVKIFYDISCVLISFILSFILLRRLTGFGIATLASAYFVGKCVGWIRLGAEKVKTNLNRF